MPSTPESAALVAANAACELAASQDYPAGALYVVATPIGNLADVTLRALHVLVRCDAVAAEDTRMARRLLDAWHIAGKPLVAAHEHNENEAAAAVLQRLRAGERVALVTDAGTPSVSDPGARIVAAVRDAGLRVVPIPGASSLTTALSACGPVAADGAFFFAGFLPARPAQRRARLRELAALRSAIVVLEAPHRVRATVADMAIECPRRTLTIARELTKRFEEFAAVATDAAPAWFDADPNRIRGEFVLVLSAPDDAAAVPDAGFAALAVLLEELPLKQAVALAARLSGASRNALYERALAGKPFEIPSPAKAGEG